VNYSRLLTQSYTFKGGLRQGFKKCALVLILLCDLLGLDSQLAELRHMRMNVTRFFAVNANALIMVPTTILVPIGKVLSLKAFVM
jgi:hypothetical protein